MQAADLKADIREETWLGGPGTVLAVEEINAAGGVNGRKLELVTRDTQSDPTKAVNGSTELARRQKAHVIWGALNSGEALAASQGFGVEPARIHEIAAELADVHSLGVQIAIVVGGGNFFRGVAEQARDMDRVSADHMGMLATVINALALQDALEKQGIHTRVQSAIEMNQVAEPFIRRRAIRHLEKGRVVIFAGGTGNPYFSTDTAASLRAMEIKADAILKATKVDGVYDADPMLVKDAKKFTEITYMDVLRKGLKVMDSTAISLCKDNNLPIIVFNLNHRGNIRKVLTGEKVGSLVSA